MLEHAGVHAGCQPASVGRVQEHFVSATSYSDREADMATLRAGLRISDEIVSQHAFDAVRGEEAWPRLDLSDDAALDEYIRNTVHSGNALAGTCKMGRPADPLSVVDAELRVKGTHGLRVVDASVIPTMPGGQLGATVFALADRACRLILGGAKDSAKGSAEATRLALAIGRVPFRDERLSYAEGALLRDDGAARLREGGCAAVPSSSGGVTARPSLLDCSFSTFTRAVLLVGMWYRPASTHTLGMQAVKKSAKVAPRVRDLFAALLRLPSDDSAPRFRGV